MCKFAINGKGGINLPYLQEKKAYKFCYTLCMKLYVASDLNLHCLPLTLLRVSRKECVNLQDIQNRLRRYLDDRMRGNLCLISIIPIISQ